MSQLETQQAQDQLAETSATEQRPAYGDIATHPQTSQQMQRDPYHHYYHHHYHHHYHYYHPHHHHHYGHY